MWSLDVDEVAVLEHRVRALGNVVDQCGHEASPPQAVMLLQCRAKSTATDLGSNSGRHDSDGVELGLSLVRHAQGVVREVQCRQSAAVHHLLEAAHPVDPKTDQWSDLAVVRHCYVDHLAVPIAEAPAQCCRLGVEQSRPFPLATRERAGVIDVHPRVHAPKLPTP
ncbi:hypothetical protein [Nocardioides sp. Iso805N]|uniref:hypothetical protein n=1 Tax=Nocardioides sp. Iso805N TaxID=1283287 RepID=UPI0003629EA6|nr:hypothetical protein [Nocardioides sp. Iso805N]